MGKSYSELFIWYESVDVAAEIVLLTDSAKRSRYALIDQMQRAAVSVPSNIAEGKGRLTDKEQRHFLGIARGSLFDRMRKIGAGINNLMRTLDGPTPKRLNGSTPPSS